EERALEALEVAGVRDRELRLVRDAREEAKLPLGEDARRLRHRDQDAAEAAAVGRERRRDVLALDERLAAAEALELRRVEGERLGGRERTLGHVSREAPAEDERTLLLAVAAARTRYELAGRRLLEPQRRPRRAEDRRGAVDDAVEDLVQPLRSRKLAPELEQRLRALGLAPLGLVEARVLERDRGLAGEHLEQADVVLVELIEAELRDPDDADHARAEAQRDVDLRLLDHVRPRHLTRVLAVRRVRDEERLAGLGDAPGDPLADLAREDVHRRLLERREVAAEGDRDDVLAVDDEDAAVVVVDQRPELVRDHRPDVAHVDQPVELAAQALE